MAARPEDRARSRYSRVAVALHWTIALMIVGNLAVGLLFDRLEDADKPLYFTAVQLHKSFGLTVLALSLARFGWRLANPPPALPDHMTPTEHLLAKLTHWGFYGLMLALPLTGWLMISASPLDFPTLWFGLFEVPKFPLAKSGETAGLLNDIHEWLAYLAIATLALHVAGALKHHFLDRDDVLARMLPVRPRG